MSGYGVMTNPCHLQVEGLQVDTAISTHSRCQQHESLWTNGLIQYKAFSLCFYGLVFSLQVLNACMVLLASMQYCILKSEL